MAPFPLQIFIAWPRLRVSFISAESFVFFSGPRRSQSRSLIPLTAGSIHQGPFSFLPLLRTPLYFALCPLLAPLFHASTRARGATKVPLLLSRMFQLFLFVARRRLRLAFLRTWGKIEGRFTEEMHRSFSINLLLVADESKGRKSRMAVLGAVI